MQPQWCPLSQYKYLAFYSSETLAGSSWSYSVSIYHRFPCWIMWAANSRCKSARNAVSSHQASRWKSKSPSNLRCYNTEAHPILQRSSHSIGKHFLSTPSLYHSIMYGPLLTPHECLPCQTMHKNSRNKKRRVIKMSPPEIVYGVMFYSHESHARFTDDRSRICTTFRSCVCCSGRQSFAEFSLYYITSTTPGVFSEIYEVVECIKAKHTRLWNTLTACRVSLQKLSQMISTLSTISWLCED